MSGPINVTCNVSPCEIVHSIVFPALLEIDTAGGAQIAGAILAVWAVAFGIRAIAQTLRNSDGVSSKSESES